MTKNLGRRKPGAECAKNKVSAVTLGLKTLPICKKLKFFCCKLKKWSKEARALGSRTPRRAGDGAEFQDSGVAVLSHRVLKVLGVQLYSSLNNLLK